VLAPGQTFGRYVVEELLGAGGMGQVYRAHDTVLHRHVALKLLLAEQGDPAQWEEAKARMLREARSAAALQHPSAVAIYDLGTVDGTPYIAMELVPGQALRDYVGDASVPWDRKLRWMVDVASALAAAHAAGLVHRDVKPENILVRPDGRVKVLDFGIARRTSTQGTDATVAAGTPTTQITGAGTILGTPRYMPPEQIAGRPLDGRADQFAWAVTTYELLAGAAPWPEKTDALATAAAILTEQPPPLLTVAPQLPQAVTQAIDRALSKRPDDRYPSMDDLVAELDGLAAPVVPAGPTSGPSLSNRPSGRRSVDAFAPTQARPETGKALAADRGGTTVRRTKRSAWLLPVAVTLGLLALASGFVARSRTQPLPQPAAAPSSAPSGLAVTDLPRPTTSNPGALTAYVAGVQAQHDASRDLARAQLGKALEADPSMGAAHLRYALSAFFPSPVTPRKHFLQASQLRASMSPYDQALLDGVEPVFDRQPPDFAEADRKLDAATAKLPGDAELYAWLAWVRFQEGKLPELAQAAAGALKIDPRYAAVHEIEAQAAQLAGDTDATLRAVDACLQAAPQAVACVLRRMTTLAADGRCADYQSDARRITAIDPDSSDGYGPLAESSFVLGRPIDAVWEALAQEWSKLDRDDATWQQANDRFTLTSLLGDAAGQDAALRAMGKAAKGRAEIYYHTVPAWGGVHVATEAGDLARAAAIADDFLRHRDAWTPDPGIDMWSIGLDQTPFLLKALVRGGKLPYSDFQAKRREWIDGWKQRVGPEVARYLWIYGYALVTDTPDEASEALAALPDFEPLPALHPSLLAEADIGHTFQLAGRVDDAIPRLRRAAGTCNAFENQFEYVQSNLWLGQALEAKGDAAGACKAYGQVTSRWGKLGRRSVSATAAAARIVALRCGKE
jgi:eukaryotic-like serine/threonine-protein kinase